MSDPAGRSGPGTAGSWGPGSAPERDRPQPAGPPAGPSAGPSRLSGQSGGTPATAVDAAPEPGGASALLRGMQLRGRRVLLVGAGSRVLGLTGVLLERGAVVTIVAPQVVTSLQDLAERSAVTWLARDYRSADLAGQALVIAAAPAEVTAAVEADAQACGVLCLRPVGPAPATQRSGYWPIADAEPAVGAAAGAELPRASSEGPDVLAGSVVLVGGGPGDGGLLTLAGWQALRAADVVVIDRLAPWDVLPELSPEVQVIDVAKIPRGRFTPQERINEILIEHARAGRRVVRFKGGDSFVFGRGMEEVLACREAGIPVHVIPGVTSCVAAPALAGIPVTHRGLVQGFVVVSGHAAPDDPRSTVDWAALAASGLTIVLLMGVHTLPSIAAALVAGGRSGDTPVACVMDASGPRQRAAHLDLAQAAAGHLPDGISPPAVTVIGDVAALGATSAGADARE